MADVAPLDDPAYDPVHKPVRGRVPDVVKLWGKSSQLRWWRRFRAELYEQLQALPVHERNALPHDTDAYWCQSEHHKGFCCYSCFEEGEGGYDDHCCCKDERGRR